MPKMREYVLTLSLYTLFFSFALVHGCGESKISEKIEPDASISEHFTDNMDEEKSHLSETNCTSLCVQVFAGAPDRVGDLDGLLHAARFNYLTDLLETKDAIYLVDRNNHKIKVIKDGKSRTLAGTGQEGYKDGAGNEAMFSFPFGAALDSKGNLFVTELGAGRIRRISPNGVVSTLAGGRSFGFQDGFGDEALFSYSMADISIDHQDNLYVSDSYNVSIRKITPDGDVTTIGYGKSIFLKNKEKQLRGQPVEFPLQQPTSLKFDTEGRLYIADWEGNSIWRIEKSGEVARFAGTGERGDKDGPRQEAELFRVNSLAFHRNGELFFAESGNRKIKKIDTAGQVKTVVSSVTGVLRGALPIPIGNILDMEFAEDGSLYFIEANFHVVRKLWLNCDCPLRL